MATDRALFVVAELEILASRYTDDIVVDIINNRTPTSSKAALNAKLLELAQEAANIVLDHILRGKEDIRSSRKYSES